MKNAAGMSYFIILIFGAAFSVFFCVRRAKGFSISNLMLKTVSSLCFVLTGITAVLCNPLEYAYGLTIVFGGMLDLCGDIMLDLKGLHEKYKNKYMMSGFLFFLAGHIFYEMALIGRSGLKFYIVLLCLLTGIIVSSLNYLYSVKIARYDFGDFKQIVWLYTVFLVLTTALGAAAMIASHFKAQYIVMTAGGALFMLSDAILCGTYFGEGYDKPVHYFLNHLTYYAAQLLIMSSIYLMK